MCLEIHLSISLDGFQDVPLQTSTDPQLLHASAHRLDPIRLRPALKSSDDDLPVRHADRDLQAPVHRQRPVHASGAARAAPRVSAREVRDERGALDAHEPVVDRVPLEDVPERARDDERDARRLERRRGLLARGARAEVVPGDEDDAALHAGPRRRMCVRAVVLQERSDEPGKGGVVVLHHDLGLARERDVVLVRVFPGVDAVGVQVVLGGEEQGARERRGEAGHEGLARGRRARRRRLRLGRGDGEHRRSRGRERGGVQRVRAADVSPDGARGDDGRAGEVCLRIRVAHPTLVVPVRRADAHLAFLQEPGSEADAGPAARGEDLRAARDERFPVAEALAFLLHGGARGCDVELDAGCDLVAAHDGRGGGDV